MISLGFNLYTNLWFHNRIIFEKGKCWFMGYWMDDALFNSIYFKCAFKWLTRLLTDFITWHHNIFGAESWVWTSISSWNRRPGAGILPLKTTSAYLRMGTFVYSVWFLLIIKEVTVNYHHIRGFLFLYNNNGFCFISTAAAFSCWITTMTAVPRSIWTRKTSAVSSEIGRAHV